ncbi:pectate lyase [Orenia metallireducens]|uniref:Pectate lyase n=1 Tax=Orenia metallireducens TaxID=1413210 RepID=A0A285GNS1_9FIRM|nr:hypothetical protein [Orenia metallireducens]PRX29832.1 pectate lyase [Orenia metallireducens]SNY25207.1 Pectate lyase [Orenia metallireducens]
MKLTEQKSYLLIFTMLIAVILLSACDGSSDVTNDSSSVTINVAGVKGGAVYIDSVTPKVTLSGNVDNNYLIQITLDGVAYEQSTEISSIGEHTLVIKVKDSDGIVVETKSITFEISDSLDSISALAFPTAEGAGANTIGGRGGDVYVVTNLNDSGEGSLRYGIEQSDDPRTIVFAVSGTIHLKSQLNIKNGDLTIAGQTAPGDGICVANYGTVINANNVIIRFMRFRLGDATNSKPEVDSLWVNQSENVILDHVSASWSIDETLSVSESDNVTIQYSIISQSLNNSYHHKGEHGYGSLVRGEQGAEYTFHHNLWAHHNNRTPRPGNYLSYQEDSVGLYADFENNVIYNWGGSHGAYNADKDSVSHYNFINNYFKSGPDSSSKSYIFYEQAAKAEGYFAGNSLDEDEPSDPYSLVKYSFKNLFGQSESAIISEYKQTSKFIIGNVAVTLERADEAYDNVLASAGAFPRDDVDIRIINDVKDGTGNIIDSQEEVGGWPELESTTAPTDTDQDGMPDSWESNHGLNFNDSSDASTDQNQDGYTNLEEYLNYRADKLLNS